MDYLVLLDIAPWPRETERVTPIKVVDEKEAKNWKLKKVETKEEAKARKKAEKAKRKAEKKAEKARKKAEKKAEKARKKAEKKAKKNYKNLSSTSTGTVTTTETETTPTAEANYAAMPVGVVLAVCASLLICVGSAWLYRRRRVKSEA